MRTRVDLPASVGPTINTTGPREARSLASSRSFSSLPCSVTALTMLSAFLGSGSVLYADCTGELDVAAPASARSPKVTSAPYLARPRQPSARARAHARMHCIGVLTM